MTQLAPAGPGDLAVVGWRSALVVTELWSVDVELVPFGVLHSDRVVVDSFLVHDDGDGGAQAHQAVGFGVHSLLPRLDRVCPVTAGVDVDVQPVLHSLRIQYRMEPDGRSTALRVADPVRAPGQRL